MSQGSSENFSLRWDSFHSNLSTSFHTLLQGEELVDVTVAAEGRFVQAHKLVLSVCSPYFKSLFKVNPCQHPIVILKDVGHKELVSMLEFMYRGEVNVSQEDLAEFLKTAELLQIKGLTGDDTPEEQEEQETKPKDTPAREPPPPPPDPQPPKVRTPQKSPVKVSSPQPMTLQPMIPMTPQPLLKTETVSKSEVVQPPPQKRMRQEQRQESPQYNPPRRSPSVPHATMPQTSTPSRNPVSSTNESCLDSKYPSRDVEYVEMPTTKVEPVEFDSDIEEVDTNFDETTDFSEFFAGQSSQQQSFQDFSAVGLPDGQSGASQALGIPQEGEQGGVEFVTSSRGKTQLIHNGFVYNYSYDRKNGRGVVWLCMQRQRIKCQARVLMIGNEVVASGVDHCHQPHSKIIHKKRVRENMRLHLEGSFKY